MNVPVHSDWSRSNGITEEMRVNRALNRVISKRHFASFHDQEADVFRARGNDGDLTIPYISSQFAGIAIAGCLVSSMPATHGTLHTHLVHHVFARLGGELYIVRYLLDGARLAFKLNCPIRPSRIGSAEEVVLILEHCVVYRWPISEFPRPDQPSA
jgi:hypothetical protein